MSSATIRGLAGPPSPEAKVDDPMQNTGLSAVGPNPPEHCNYCGGRLNPAYYFCVACGTPYKELESVLPRSSSRLLTDGARIAQKAPHVAGLFWTFVAVVVGSAVVCYVLFGESRPALSLLLQSAALFVTTGVFASVHWRSLLVQFKRWGLFKPAAWLAIGALFPLLAVNYFYHGWVMRELGAESSLPFKELRESGLGEPGLILFVCVFPAVVEEIAFRGLVLHWLGTAVSAFRALVLSSALFTALHFSVLSAPYIFGIGMLLGWAKWKTASLYPSMLIHFLHNLVVLELFWR